MNHHADKLVEPLDANEAKSMDLVIGGIIDEFHACPNCGLVDMRLGQ